MDNFDVAIIGGGPGGTAAAGVLASHDKKVAIIEDRDWGGACLNRGCVPTKLFLGAITPLSELDSLGGSAFCRASKQSTSPFSKNA